MRLLVVSCEPAFRYGLRVIVEADPDLRLVADVADARSCFSAMDVEKPDVVLIDVALKGLSGVDTAREVRRRSPRMHVLLLASWACERDALEGFRAGADGYALKTDPVGALKEAIRTVAAGRRYVTPELRGVLAQQDGRPRSDEGDVLGVLSAREREVLDLVVKGRSSMDIARELCISIKTVETHRHHINRKLGCSSAAALTRFAADNGLLRSGPSAGARPHDQTTVVVVDTRSEWHAQLLRLAEARRYPVGRSTNASRALGDVRQASSPVVVIVENAPSNNPGARVACTLAALSQADIDSWFKAVLDASGSDRSTSQPTLGLLSSA